MDKTAGSTRGLQCQTLICVTTFITDCVVASQIKILCLKYGNVVAGTCFVIAEMIHFMRRTFDNVL